jgi:hypothetical protein
MSLCADLSLEKSALEKAGAAMLKFKEANLSGRGVLNQEDHKRSLHLPLSTSNSIEEDAMTGYS